MKKMFTLFALLAVFLGANAEWVEKYKIDFSTYSAFPFYVMGYVPEFDNGCMTDFGAAYRYATQDVLDNGDGNGNGKLTAEESIAGTVMAGGTEYQKVTGAGPYWHQYFIADGIETKLDGKYKVVAMVKANSACTINVNMGWGWGGGEQAGASVAIPEGSDFQEVTWQYEGIGGSSCNLVAQPGSTDATLEWLSVIVYEWKKDGQKPQEWISVLENGDAENAWPAWSLNETGGINTNWRTDKAPEICAWALTMGRNFDDQCPAEVSGDSYRARPYPADIEPEEGNESNHVFAVHVKEIAPIDDGNPDTDDSASTAWSNQFWIESPGTTGPDGEKTGWLAGSKVKIKFRYKASVACSASTQIHKMYPSDYLYWQAVGDVAFTTEWQKFEKTYTFDANTNGGWSLAFNLNNDATNGRTAPIDFYFDDLSWEYLKLEDGFFVSGIDTNTNPKGEYDDLDTAIQFEEGVDPDGDPCLVATVGESGKYVDQIILSTKRGDDEAYKGNALMVSDKIVPGEWVDYTSSSNARINLPGLGVWKIYLDTEYSSLLFELVEGSMYETIEINPNPIVYTVNAGERDWLVADNNGNAREGEEGNIGTGQTYNNQMFIKANRVLNAGEETVIEFDYVATKDAKVSTQCHAQPGAYIHWGAIGDINFTTEEQHFHADFTIPNECAGKDMQTIAFNMSEIKAANDYTIKNVVWKLKSDTESLIDQTGDANFSKNEFDYPTGISNVVNDNKASNVIYNLAGQRVSKEFKGLVIKNGAKYIAK